MLLNIFRKPAKRAEKMVDLDQKQIFLLFIKPIFNVRWQMPKSLQASVRFFQRKNLHRLFQFRNCSGNHFQDQKIVIFSLQLDFFSIIYQYIEIVLHKHSAKPCPINHKKPLKYALMQIGIYPEPGHEFTKVSINARLVPQLTDTVKS